MCANFQQKWITLTFLAQICPKTDLGLEIQKTNVERGIFEILFVPIFKQKKTTLPFLAQICPKIDFGIRILEILVWIRNQHLHANFQSKWTTLNSSALIWGSSQLCAIFWF